MIRPTTRRRDFSGHWGFTERARVGAQAVRDAAELPGRLPAVGFALMLSVLAAAGGRGRWPWAVGLLLFMLGDWAMQALLPRFGVSYGPPQPVSLVLAVARAVCGLLPVAWALP